MCVYVCSNSHNRLNMCMGESIPQSVGFPVQEFDPGGFPGEVTQSSCQLEGGERFRGSLAAVGDLHLAQTYSQVPSLPPGCGQSFVSSDGVKRHLGVSEGGMIWGSFMCL